MNNVHHHKYINIFKEIIVNKLYAIKWIIKNNYSNIDLNFNLIRFDICNPTTL